MKKLNLPSISALVAKDQLMDAIRTSIMSRPLKPVNETALLDRAFDVLKGMIYNRTANFAKKAVQDVLATHKIVHGDREAETTAEGIQNWSTALEGSLEELFDANKEYIGVGWAGEVLTVADFTRGDVQEKFNRIAEGFASAVSTGMVDRGSPAKSLSAVAIVHDDVQTLVKEAAALAGSKKKRTEAPPVMDVAALIRRAMDFPHYDGPNGLNSLRADMDSASDSDEVLAASGAQRLGVTMDEAAALRSFRASGGKDWTETLLQAAMSGEQTVNPPPPPPTTTPAPGTEPPKDKPKRGRQPKGTVTSLNALEALKGIKAHARISDEDLAAAVGGVSKTQLNNYLNGKAPFAPDATILKAMADVVTRHVEGLREAAEFINAASQGVITAAVETAQQPPPPAAVSLADLL